MNPRTQLAVAATSVTLLSATSLHAVFVDTAWVAPVVGVVLAVLVGAEIGSRLGQHLAARPVWRLVGSALAAIFFITGVYAREGAIFGFIPRGHTWHLLNAMRHKAFTEIHNLPTPAPTYRAIMMITTFGVAAVAIAVDQLSVRAPLIGLPLLALYSVPEWLSHNGTGWVPLALGGSGYVGLLIREGRDRTSRWGRTVTGASPVGRDRSAATAMSQAGWRIGAVALAVALVVPPLIPDLAHFNLAKGGGVASGAVIHYDPVSSLGGNLRQGVTTKQYSYQSSDGQGHYLRFTTLQLNGSGFSASNPSADDGVDPTRDTLTVAGVNPSVPTTSLNTSVAITNKLGQAALPIPEGTQRIENLDGSWSYEQSSETVFGRSSHSTVNQHYTATSKTLSPQPIDLQKSTKLTSSDAEYAEVADQLTVPKALPPVVKQKALAVTQGLTTPYEKAIAIQNFFLDPHRFKYSLYGPTGHGFSALQAFLTTQPAGYCQDFADAMALMARTVGIPSRLGMGFTTGVTTGNSGIYVVTNHDSHVWPELYFKGVGWLRFEPTPRGDGTTFEPPYAAQTVTSIQGLSATIPKGSSSYIPSDPIQKLQPHRGGGLGATKNHSSFSLPVSGETLAWIVGAIALVVLVVGYPVLRTTTRRRRLRAAGDSRAVALLAWRQTLTDAYDLGHVSSAADSPRQAARRLTESASLTGSAAASLERLARAVEKARYAQLAGESAGLLDAAESVNVAMYANASRRTRLRAKTLPPSAVAAMSEAWARRLASVSRTYGAVVARVSGWSNRLLRRESAPLVAPPVEERPPVGAGR